MCTCNDDADASGVTRSELFCPECGGRTAHVAFTDAGGCYTECQECGRIAYDGPDPEAIREGDLNAEERWHFNLDLTADEGDDGSVHHVEPPC